MLVKAYCLADYTNQAAGAFMKACLGGVIPEWGVWMAVKNQDVHVTMAGHTHIDVAWLWRFSHTREKAARSFSTVDRLMEKYPEYHFLQSQPQLYEFIKEDHPDIYEKIKKRVKEGKWELTRGHGVE